MNYVVTTTLPYKFAGRTKSLLHRTKSLNSWFDLDFKIISTNFDPDIKLKEIYYLEKNYINKNIKLENIYNYFFNKNINKKINMFFFTEKNLQIKMKNEKLKIKIEKDEGKYTKNHFYLFNLKKQTDVYNSNGRKVLTIKYSKNLEEHYYFNKESNTYMYKKIENKKIKIIILFSNGEILKFKTEKSLFNYFFKNVIKGNGLLFNDARLLDKPIIEAELNTKNIFVIHNSHHEVNNKNLTKKSYEYLLKNINENNVFKTIVLTETQKNDINSLYPTEKLIVIPHFIENKLNILDNFFNFNRKKDNIIYLGRIAREKRIEHVIKALSIVRSSNMKFTFNIYGNGEEKYLIELKSMVKDLNLENNIFFKGRTDNVKKIFMEASLSTCTSEHEGFCLSIMESLHYKCPVISYNIDYGPADLIKNYENGILINNNNIEELAEKIKFHLTGRNKITARLDEKYYAVAVRKLWNSLIT